MSPFSPDDYRLLFESAPGLHLVLTPDLEIAAASDAYLRATMTAREAIVGRPVFDVFPDDPADPAASAVASLRASLARVVAERRADAMAVQEYPVRSAGGAGAFERRFWSPLNSPVLRSDGTLAFILHSVEDVTEYLTARHLESTHAKAVDELRTRAGAMESEIYRRARDIQEANQRLRELGSELERRVEERTAELVRANADLSAQMAQRQRAEAALRATEEQLHRSQKLDAIGRLAGGVAHDFNNLLSVVISFGQTLLSDPALPEKLRPDVMDIRDAGLRAAELTQQLLTFSRRSVVDSRAVDVLDIAREIESLLRRVLGEDVELAFILAPGSASVHIERSQFESVLMNLVVNARDAMPHGGTLTVEIARVEVDDAEARVHLDLAPGPYVLLAVTDTGTGMDAATQARMFEPFFTTKEAGRGSGLGLATVFGVVKQAAGAIGVHSKLGAGTTFNVYLPRADQPAGLRASLPVHAEVVGGDETVLLVEDDDAVRRVAMRILRDLGYHVLEQRSPTEALSIVEEHPERIDALVTDVVMPELDGAELAARVRALHPGIRVLFMSGYTGDVVLRHAMPDHEVAFLEKPITPRGLGLKLRAVLDGPRPAAGRPER